MLETFITLLRSFFAHRTIDGIVGELQDKANKLKAAEAVLLAHGDLKAAIVEEAKVALEALLAKTAVEAKILADKIEQSRKVRAKITV